MVSRMTISHNLALVAQFTIRSLVFLKTLTIEFFARKRESWFIGAFQGKNKQTFCNSHEKKRSFTVRGPVTKSRFTRKKFAISQFTGNKKGLSRVTKKPFTTLRTNWGKQRFIYQSVVDWNSLSQDTRKTPFLSHFKSKLKLKF